jgi:hypothetical protein
MAEYKNIIKYWKLIEQFTPPKVEIRDKNKFLYLESIQDSITKNDSIAWINRKKFQHLNSKTNIWSYRVFLGIIDVNHINEMINNIFEGNFNTDLGKPNYFSTIACFKVNSDGVIKYDSLEIPDYFISIANLKEFGPDNNKSFSDGLDLKYKMEKIFSNFCDSDEGKIINYQDLDQILSLFLKEAKLNKDFTRSVAIIHSYNFPIKKKDDKKPSENNQNEEDNKDIDSNAILNSFFYKDLSLIESKISDKNKISESLKEYLSDFSENKRIDLISDKKYTKEILSPKNLAAAKWPNKGNHSLALAQQMAVNISMKKDSGIFSVNGPPGTGKTTLLRDLIANIIVKRAKKMLPFNNPQDAYQDKIQFTFDGRNYNIYKISKELQNYEIFVASSNNNAVENITKEIPKRSEIDDKLEMDYFSEIAKNIFGDDVWGLGSAILGSRSNCSKFFHKLWFDKDKKNNITNLKEYLKNKLENIGWAEAKEQFSQKLQEFEEYQAKLIDLENILDHDGKFEKELQDLTLTYNLLQDKERKIKLKKEDIILKIDNINLQILENNNLLESLKILRPNIFVRILSKFKNNEYITWKDKNHKIIDNLISYREKKDIFERNLKSIKIELDQISYLISDQITKITKLQEKIKDNQDKINYFKEKMGVNFTDHNFWQENDRNLQLRNPWLFEDLEKIRGELFIAAMNLHKAFIINARDKFISNINAVNLMMQGKISQDVTDYVKSLWSNFSILIPVFSSTFASFSNLCQSMFKEDIGYLFIDEAGQSLPHHAAGAIYRSKNVVIVGDPMQIPPVSEIPEIMSKSLLKFCNISTEYDICQNSVQDLADRVNIYGTYIMNDAVERWIGCPLRIHRRCKDPIFSISNHISYDNLMIQSVKNKNIAAEKIFPKSKWIDIKSDFSDSHYIIEEGEKAMEIIIQIIAQYQTLPSLYVISPFRNVALSFKKYFKNQKNNFSYLINNDKIDKWIDNNIGTIHSFQGKEADIVILLLGGNPANEGAINWATKNPNILNVAITRAKNLLLVIGSKKRWSRKPNFVILNEYLDKFNEEENIYSNKVANNLSSIKSIAS